MLKHLDFNMSAGTVLVALATMYLGFVGVRFAWNKTTEMVSNAFSGVFAWAGPATSLVLAGGLAIGGFTGIGMGVGELSSGDRPEDKVAVTPLTNSDLLKLATNEKVTKDNLDAVLKHAKDRDDAQVKMLEKLKTEQANTVQFVSTNPQQIQPTATIDVPNRRTAWLEVFGGIGSLICAAGISMYRFVVWHSRY
jgi:hypothetical protein